jgi:hypothetical protein
MKREMRHGTRNDAQKNTTKNTLYTTITFYIQSIAFNTTNNLYTLYTFIHVGLP